MASGRRSCARHSSSPITTPITWGSWCCCGALSARGRMAVEPERAHAGLITDAPSGMRTIPLPRIDGALAPRHRHRRRAAVQIAARVLGTILEPGDESHQLLDRLLVDLAALLRSRQLRLAQNARLGVAARPRDQRRRAGGKQVDPVEWTLLGVEADDTALDQVTPDVVAIEVEVQ